MAGTSDWLDVRGWMESIVGWSMDQVHDLLPSSDIGLGPLGSVNLQGEFASIQGALETFLFTTIMCTIVFATMMLTLMVVPYICLLYTSPSPRDGLLSRMPSSA